MAPEGYEKVEMQEWASIHGVAPSAVLSRIAFLQEKYPDEFYRRSVRGVFYVSEKARQLLVAELDALKPADGYQALDASGLRKQFQIKSNAFNYMLDKLAAIYPSEIVRRGKNRSIIVTEKGYSLLIAALEQRLQ